MPPRILKLDQRQAEMKARHKPAAKPVFKDKDRVVRKEQPDRVRQRIAHMMNLAGRTRV